MPRGGCLTCMHGGYMGYSMNALIKLNMTIGIFLIMIGIILYNKDILDIRIQEISKETLNNYFGYASVFVGILLIAISAISWRRA
jgi:predicted tellurium resistance membrane protein TerC